MAFEFSKVLLIACGLVNPIHNFLLTSDAIRQLDSAY